MKHPQKKPHGFTLIELMIVVAIIGILIAVAVAAYPVYQKKTRFTEVELATAPLKLAVEECVATSACISSGAIANIAPGASGIPSLPAASGKLASMALAPDGTITATGTTEVDGATYILTPRVTATGADGGLAVTWTVGGSCLQKGFCRQ